jgi:hypothetical protein
MLPFELFFAPLGLSWAIAKTRQKAGHLFLHASNSIGSSERPPAPDDGGVTARNEAAPEEKQRVPATKS